jgi:putative hydrolase of the HAD superfamily
LAVVSDAWPDLPRLHEALGMVDCFELYAISGVLGWTKPDPRLFRHASDSLGLSPGECLFVDDSVELVEAAAALGYRAVVMRRGGEPVPHHVRAISSLHGVLDLLGP